MKVLSLFDGISVARTALARAGHLSVDYYASEIDAPAIKTALKNYPDTQQLGSVVGLAAPSGIDLLIGGSPCQDLSIANNARKGLSGHRSGLFYEYARILKEAKPTYFVLENVASMPKEAKQIITQTLGVEPIMIDAALVSAQRRKRLFWTNIPNVSQPQDRGIFVKDILESEVDESYFISEDALASILEKMRRGRPLPQSQRIYSTDAKAVTLQAGGGGVGAKTGLYVIVPEATKRATLSLWMETRLTSLFRHRRLGAAESATRLRTL